MRESPCSVGGGVDSSNHQFPRQTFPIRLQVRLRVGRLTLGLTVADRWECSQATGLPAWRHQDLHITASRAHGITGTQTEESVLRYWSRLDLMYKHVNGDSGRLRSRFASPRGEKKKAVHLSVIG